MLGLYHSINLVFNTILKNILIITYHWPPAGGPGVQRVIKFVKYLYKFGWRPIVLTVEDGEYSAYDHSLHKELPEDCVVIRVNGWRPETLYRKFVTIKKDNTIPVAVLADKSDQSIKQVFAKWIRSNIFIPDAKVGWILPAIKAARQVLVDYPIYAIFSSSPPPSVQLVAKRLSRIYKIPWIADFRDPWTTIHYYEHVHRAYLTRSIDEWLELSVLKSANYITCANYGDLKTLKSRWPYGRFKYLPNGYDESDFSKIELTFNKIKFIITHLGSIGEERTPTIFFRALKKLINSEHELRNDIIIEFIGNVNQRTIDEVKYYGLYQNLSLINYLPHIEALQKASSASLLLLPLNKSRQTSHIVPGKTFEYLRLQKPILCLGDSEGEVANILKSFKAGIAVKHDDEKSIYDYISNCYNDWKTNKIKKPSLYNIQMFSRENLTKRLVELLNKLHE